MTKGRFQIFQVLWSIAVLITFSKEISGTRSLENMTSILNPKIPSAASDSSTTTAQYPTITQTKHYGIPVASLTSQNPSNGTRSLENTNSVLNPEIPSAALNSSTTTAQYPTITQTKHYGIPVASLTSQNPSTGTRNLKNTNSIIVNPKIPSAASYPFTTTAQYPDASLTSQNPSSGSQLSPTQTGENAITFKRGEKSGQEQNITYIAVILALAILVVALLITVACCAYQNRTLKKSNTKEAFENKGMEELVDMYTNKDDEVEDDKEVDGKYVVLNITSEQNDEMTTEKEETPSKSDEKNTEKKGDEEIISKQDGENTKKQDTEITCIEKEDNLTKKQDQELAIKHDEKTTTKQDIETATKQKGEVIAEKVKSITTMQDEKKAGKKDDDIIAAQLEESNERKTGEITTNHEVEEIKTNKDLEVTEKHAQEEKTTTKRDETNPTKEEIVKPSEEAVIAVKKDVQVPTERDEEMTPKRDENIFTSKDKEITLKPEENINRNRDEEVTENQNGQMKTKETEI